MGFTPQPTIYNLTFKGTSLDGLEIRIGCCTIAEFNWMTTLRPDPNKQIKEGGTTRAENVVDTNRAILGLFFKYLESWNLEDRQGQPVPMTVEGVESQEASFGGKIVGAWQTAMVAVPAPLETPSNGGPVSEEATLGLGAISGSLPS